MEETNKQYLVVASFDSAMEKVQFMDVFKTNVLVCKTKAQAERTMSHNRIRAGKHKIACTFKIVSKELPE